MARKTANKKLLDEITHRSVLLQRYSEGVRASVSVALRQLRASVVRDLKDATEGGPTEYQRARLTALLRQTNETIQSTYGEIGDYVHTRLSALADNEAKFSKRVLDVAIPVPVDTVAVGEETLAALVNQASVLGVPLKQWWEKQAESQQTLYTNAVREGMLRGETTDQIVSRVLAPEGQGGAGFDMLRAQAETLVRSSCASVANEARSTTWQENADLIEHIMWVSTLDDRTTLEFCIPRDGKLYTLDYEPVGHDLPWESGPGNIHPNCRSTSVPVLKSAAEMGIADPTPSTRSSLDGQVPGTTTYEDWLRDKPAEFQNEVLGPTRAEMWRDGRIDTLRDLLDQRGRALTIEELEERFPVAGKDPLADVAPAPSYAEDVRAFHTTVLEQTVWAYEKNMTVDEVRQVLQTRVEEQLSSVVMTRNDPPEAFMQVLRDGRYKSQFETGTSQGYLSNTHRDGIEAKLFGFDKQAQAVEERPIYGALVPKGEEPHLATRMYGSVMAYLREDVLSRSTWTGSDSLDEFGRLLPSPVKKPSIHSLLLSQPGALGAIMDRYATIPTKSSASSWIGYWEAHAHGGLSVKDIEHVVVYKTGTTATQLEQLRTMLKERGIPFKIK